MKNCCFLLLPLLFGAQHATGQIDFDSQAIRFAHASFGQFHELLSMPNDAHFPKNIEENMRWCEKAFASRGFSLKRLKTATVPLLLAGRKSSRPVAKTVLAYMHLDGQPVDTALWFQENPWKPVLKKQVEGEGWVEIPWSNLDGDLDPAWRIFGRSASDDKGPAMALLAALDALHMMNNEPACNLKVIMDFEEELGSPHLPQAVADYRDDLAADVLVIFDGPRHISNEPTLTFGARGIADVTLTVYGPAFPQHSGHYGNYCPNPALRLAQLLASMKDDGGRVTIPGFYDGIELDEATRGILAAVPDDEKAIRDKLGIAAADKVAANYQESLQYPSLNIRGLSAGWVREEARTIIPATAVAEIDIRLVLESDPERLIGLLRKHIEGQGYHVVDHAPGNSERQLYDKICRFDYSISYEAFRTEPDSGAGQWLSRAMLKAFGKEPVKIRTAGGSVPISPFVKTLNIP
ncbi:MAG: M20/M25/M40 family metallo-hydrolase, partial [Saprospiraceae bacterium]